MVWVVSFRVGFSRSVTEGPWVWLSLQLQVLAKDRRMNSLSQDPFQNEGNFSSRIPAAPTSPSPARSPCISTRVTSKSMPHKDWIYIYCVRSVRLTLGWAFKNLCLITIPEQLNQNLWKWSSSTDFFFFLSTLDVSHVQPRLRIIGFTKGSQALLKHRLLKPTLRVSGSLGGRGEIICLSHKFPGDAAAAGQEITFWIFGHGEGPEVHGCPVLEEKQVSLSKKGQWEAGRATSSMSQLAYFF